MQCMHYYIGVCACVLTCVCACAWSRVCVCVSEVLQSWSIQQDSPISTVLLFPLHCQTDSNQEGYNLLVTSTIEMAVVYR